MCHSQFNHGALELGWGQMDVCNRTWDRGNSSNMKEFRCKDYYRKKMLNRLKVWRLTGGDIVKVGVANPILG